MKMKKSLFGFCLCLFISFLWCANAYASEDITIFYTNDIHSYIDNDIEEGKENELTYSKVAALKSEYPNSLLVDAGDHVQGTAYGGMDRGETIIRLMNAAGYDMATLGNHEFDYGMERCLELTQMADYPYVSCNFYTVKDGVFNDNVLEKYIILERNNKKIAFIGITTPETKTSTTPTYFKDAKGNYIYDFAGGSDGSGLYECVQSTIDAAKEEGADYIIAIGHLGVDPSSKPWTSEDVIANTSGLDAFIDGHSHTIIESAEVIDKDGKKVILTQTGSYLATLGCMTIKGDGTIITTLINGDDVADIEADVEVKKLEIAWIEEIDSKLGEVIGYSEIVLDNYDENGTRLVRRQPTNTGMFSADALYYLFEEMDMDVDVAIMNGGGVRNQAIKGELTYLTCKEIHTFGNVACLQKISGQQLLDALEWSVSELKMDGSVEEGSFLHVSGARYTVDLTVPSTVQRSDDGVWNGAPTGKYRVSNVEIYNKETQKYEALDLNANYNLAGYNYTVRSFGGGYNMLEGAVNVLDYVAEDYMVLANYIQSFPIDEKTGLPTISKGSKYDDLYGSGNVTFVGATYRTAAKEMKRTSRELYEIKAGDCLWALARQYYGNGSSWRNIYEMNMDVINNPRILRIGQKIIIPID